MSFESFSQVPVDEPKKEEKVSKPSTFGTKTKRLFHSLVLGAALGQAVEAQDLNTHQESAPDHSKITKYMESKIDDKVIEEIYLTENGFKWGIQYVPKKLGNKSILASRYVKIDEATGETTLIGEYDNVRQAAENLPKIPDIPEIFARQAKRIVGLVDTEKSFQASGLVEGVKNPVGKTHVEERTFKGNGLDLINKVEVDEVGNVVSLVESKDRDGNRYK